MRQKEQQAPEVIAEGRRPHEKCGTLWLGLDGHGGVECLACDKGARQGAYGTGTRMTKRTRKWGRKLFVDP